MMRSRRSEQQNEQVVQLDQVLEPYNEQNWADGEMNVDSYAVNHSDSPQTYAADDQEYYGEEYSEEHEAADSENHFRIAIGMFDLISIIIGIAVVFVLVGMLITLFNWLRNDIFHSALLLQSGLR